MIFFGKYETDLKVFVTDLQIHINFSKKRTKITYIDIYSALKIKLTKIVAIYAFLVCEIFGPKIWSYHQYHHCFSALVHYSSLIKIGKSGRVECLTNLSDTR